MDFDIDEYLERARRTEDAIIIRGTDAGEPYVVLVATGANVGLFYKYTKVRGLLLPDLHTGCSELVAGDGEEDDDDGD